MQNENEYDLEERTEEFAKNVRRFVKNIPRSISRIEDIKQLVRSSGSIGANYIEANEALSKKDFLFRIRLCRKEAKERTYWLNVIDLEENDTLDNKRRGLLQESVELMKIFAAIMHKVESG